MDMTSYHIQYMGVRVYLLSKVAIKPKWKRARPLLSKPSVALVADMSKMMQAFLQPMRQTVY